MSVCINLLWLLGTEVMKALSVTCIMSLKTVLFIFLNVLICIIVNQNIATLSRFNRNATYDNFSLMISIKCVKVKTCCRYQIVPEWNLHICWYPYVDGAGAFQRPTVTSGTDSPLCFTHQHTTRAIWPTIRIENSFSASILGKFPNHYHDNYLMN